MLDDTGSGAIAKAIIALSHSMGLSVVAEGVETEQQRDFLSYAGCDTFQGYLYSPAVEVHEFERQVRDAMLTHRPVASTVAHPLRATPMPRPA
jgi:EAL domain-containing protein (putative c-di-GMP-specific phosphodiesterase class I)